MLRCYCLSEECECIGLERNCDERPTGLRCSALFSIRAGYQEEMLANILEREKAAARGSRVSRRWETLYERLYNELQIESGRLLKILSPHHQDLVSGYICL